MKHSKLTSMIAASLLIACSGSVFAAAVETTSYKMVLIENMPGVDAIQAGDLVEGIALTKSAKRSAIDTYTRNLNLCVGYTKMSKYEIAEEACTEAVKMAVNADKLPSMQMRAYAYNNRGVMKVLANDNTGALEDFKKAAKATHEPIYKQNLLRLEAELNNAETGTL
ncbi:hypothetical protein Q4601_02975 [Shewanella sp. 1_MG-2023]|jgi:hypothetical protein|uniref:hypothetical protein n=1 Tax=unclassified Shewanella TaxID=196818 RepID=UPI000C849B98|nr:MULTISPECIES: hypothetical protein [unclassified Shewanella]MCC4833002.1 hypothetical protein [Shewanella sp. 10N.7]MDO6610603.1 hypothetical protein [Shewanella sp. 7_MG-2023]MDO6770728.1 hypothetical protein [Shewanella sp. 2_MG-2023]MDO6793254.1 hypothetical protein [Shewanella sp. 1_MG-2023]